MYRALFLPLTLLALGCQPPEEDEPLVDLGDDVEDLFIPEVDPDEISALFVEATNLALGVNMRDGWDGHVQALDLMQPGCPDLYAGPPDVENVDIDVDEDAKGLSWTDFCVTPGGLSFSGYLWWENAIDVSGQLEGSDGLTLDATRTITANGKVGDEDGLLYEFDGTGTDAYTERRDTSGVFRWTYSSIVEGTVTGSIPFPDLSGPTPSGYRTDLSLYATGGDADTLDLRGNVYLFDELLGDRFDSMVFDMAVARIDPEGCDLEPLGYMGLRDPEAYWYDIVFQPRYGDDITETPYENAPLQECDGCGTLYIRGIRQDVEICPDFSGIWDQIETPSIDDYVLSMRDVAEEEIPEP